MTNYEFERMDDHDIVKYATQNYQTRKDIQTNNSALYDKLVQKKLIRETFPQESGNRSNIGDLVRTHKAKK